MINENVTQVKAGFMKTQGISKRHSRNPIILSENVPGNVMQGFNSSLAKFWLFYRVDGEK